MFKLACLWWLLPLFWLEVSCPSWAREILKKVPFCSILELTPRVNSLICFFDVGEEGVGAPSSDEHDGVDWFFGKEHHHGKGGSY